MNGRANRWQFGPREVIYGALGAVLYGLFSAVTNIFALPSIGNITFQPAVAVLIFFGVAYGPWVGLFAGLFGNMIGNVVAGWGIAWHLSMGNGLMGMIPGLMMATNSNFRARGEIARAVGGGVAGIVVGTLFASLMEILITDADLQTAFVNYFIPALLGNVLMTVLFLPVLMITFAGAVGRHKP